MCHSVACSNACASANIRFSPSRGAVIWRPMGRPSRVKPQGTLIVGTYPDSFWIIDEATQQITGSIKFGSGLPRRTALSRDRSRFYTVEAQMEKVEVIDIATRKSVRRIAFMNLAPATFGIGIAGWGIGRLGIVPSFLDVAAYAVLCVCAVAVCYALWFCSVLGAFWAGRLSNAGAIFEPVVSMARVPTTSLASPLRLAFTFVLPLAFVGTVPAQAILGIAEPWHVPYAICLAGALVIASNRLWHRALRAYSSASS